jgi:hypothetical protein
MRVKGTSWNLRKSTQRQSGFMIFSRTHQWSLMWAAETEVPPCIIGLEEKQIAKANNVGMAQSIKAENE